MSKWADEFAQRQAARRRLPRWVLWLQMVMSIVSFVAALFVGLQIFLALHRLAHGDFDLSAPINAAGFCMLFGAALALPAPALMLVNLILVQIGPLRRIFDQNAKGVPGASYSEAMKGLWKFTKIVTPSGFALGLLGALEPWARL